MHQESIAMSKWLISVFLLYISIVDAQSCDIKVQDLSTIISASGKTQVHTLAELKDPYSEEPIRRYFQAFPDGAIVILEQKHCLMYNLTVTLLLPEGSAIDTAAGRLADSLELTPTWNKWFNGLKVRDILEKEFRSKRFKSQYEQNESYSYPLDGKISVSNESSETLLRLVHLEAGILPFAKIISIYIGVGGL